jgi:hypothetical protein
MKELSFEESAAIMNKMAKLMRFTNCNLMVFDKTLQITDCDTEESHDFDTPQEALQYLENKKEYLEKQFMLINRKTS